MLSFSKNVLLFFLATVVVCFVWNWENATTRTFHASTGKPMTLANLTTVEINGRPHTMTIRTIIVDGNNPIERNQVNDRPVLLILHGGPGASDIPFLYSADYLLEEYFIVVHYDQRSAGKSCRYYKEWDTRNSTLQDHIDDGVAIVEYLRETFQQEKIYLAGGSWGSMLALTIAQQYPHLFHFVGVHGTLVNGLSNDLISREYILQKFPNADVPMPPHDGREDDMNQHFRWLVRAGGAFYQNPLKNISRYLPFIEQWAVHATYAQHLLTSPEYSYGDIVRFHYCHERTGLQMALEVQDYDAYKMAGKLDVPVLFIHGRHDHLCVVELVEDYFNALKAPWKKLLWFEKSGHFPDREESLLFQETLIHTFLNTSIPNISQSTKEEMQRDAIVEPGTEKETSRETAEHSEL